MRQIYRILDANFNRAREAMRVVEDFARFVLNDPQLSGLAKNLRSDLAQALGQLPAELLLASRDTPGDVGTGLTSPTEASRPDAAAVAAAACKRLSEALRTLEEYAKLVQPALAARFEAMRYAGYTLEQRLAQRIANAGKFDRVRLYVLLSSQLCRFGPLETAKAVIAGGADCIQLREKQMPSGPLLDLALTLRQLTADAGVLLIINDRPDIAAAVAADGVHLGQDDLPVAAARRILPAWTLVGKSTHNIQQARAAVGEGADYLGAGPVFATATKDAGPLAGTAYLRQVAAEIALPFVAIGGITLERVDEVVWAGAKRLAVCSAAISAPDPAAAAAQIKERLNKGLN